MILKNFDYTHLMFPNPLFQLRIGQVERFNIILHIFFVRHWPYRRDFFEFRQKLSKIQLHQGSATIWTFFGIWKTKKNTLLSQSSSLIITYLAYPCTKVWVTICAILSHKTLYTSAEMCTLWVTSSSLKRNICTSWKRDQNIE